jgi:hypothetical protein
VAALGVAVPHHPGAVAVKWTRFLGPRVNMTWRTVAPFERWSER